jgi:hypothetical protein
VLVAVPCIGIALYWVRERFRLLYGIFEFFVGVTMACKSLLPHLDTSGGNLTFGIKVLAGLYVAVRGLDNIGKGCEGTRLQPYWKRIFGQSVR